jgi:hypothetical protein
MSGPFGWLVGTLVNAISPKDDNESKSNNEYPDDYPLGQLPSNNEESDEDRKINDRINQEYSEQ